MADRSARRSGERSAAAGSAGGVESDVRRRPHRCPGAVAVDAEAADTAGGKSTLALHRQSIPRRDAFA
jgi:hypothetical protein